MNLEYLSASVSYFFSSFPPLSVHNSHWDLNVLVFQWHNFIYGHKGSCLTTRAVKTSDHFTSSSEAKCLFHIHALIFQWVFLPFKYATAMPQWSTDVSFCAFNEIIDNSIDSERLVWPWHLLGRLLEGCEPDIVLIYIAITHQVSLFLLGWWIWDWWHGLVGGRLKISIFNMFCAFICTFSCTGEKSSLLKDWYLKINFVI